MKITSWNHLLYATPRQHLKPSWPDQIHLSAHESQLVCGLQRSYSDVGLLSDGSMIDCTALNRIIAFDPITGTIKAQAGISLKAILDLVLPHSWMLPVVPGTQYVTLGGAIANDVHGKNHHRAGTFGCHVAELTLLTSDGQQHQLSPSKQPELFAATIGGLGLTGMILDATLQLEKIPATCLEVETIAFNNLEDFFELNQTSEPTFEYTVAWLDCQSTNNKLGRGIYLRANYAADSTKQTSEKKRHKSIPFNLPNWLLNKGTISVFNQSYFNWKKLSPSQSTNDLRTFLFPLDHLSNWYKVYGKKGFYQYQFALPQQTAKRGLTEILQLINNERAASALSSLKTFGNYASPGLLSFPMPGITLALDFPNQDSKTRNLFDKLNQVVAEHQGRIYPAKDSQMPGSLFHAIYTEPLKKFIPHIDPHFYSDFWQRMNQKDIKNDKS